MSIGFLGEATAGNGTTGHATSAADQRAALLAREQIFVRLAVLRAHHHVNDWIDAGGQVDEHVAEHVHRPAEVHLFAQRLDDRDGHVAHDERNEDDEYHLEQLAVLGRHLARVPSSGERRFVSRRAPMEGAAHLRQRRAQHRATLAGWRQRDGRVRSDGGRLRMNGTAENGLLVRRRRSCRQHRRPL